MGFVFRSHADCCAVVAAAASCGNSAKSGLAAIVMISGKSSSCGVAVAVSGASPLFRLV
jgi:hypothetical protein